MSTENIIAGYVEQAIPEMDEWNLQPGRDDAFGVNIRPICHCLCRTLSTLGDPLIAFGDPLCPGLPGLFFLFCCSLCHNKFLPTLVARYTLLKFLLRAGDTVAHSCGAPDTPCRYCQKPPRPPEIAESQPR